MEERGGYRGCVWERGWGQKEGGREEGQGTICQVLMCVLAVCASVCVCAYICML